NTPDPVTFPLQTTEKMRADESARAQYQCPFHTGHPHSRRLSEYTRLSSFGFKYYSAYVCIKYCWIAPDSYISTPVFGSTRKGTCTLPPRLSSSSRLRPLTGAFGN